MEKHKCKLCFRSFNNGRALGGHMRSHMMNFPLPTKPEDQSSSRTIQLSFEAESSSSSDDEEENGYNDDDVKGVCYGLRENPKRSIRLEDRESETESSKNPITLRRSKRAMMSLGVFNNNKYEQVMKKKMKLCKTTKTESWVLDHEPLSSVSDATTEEDVAFCLMMLSRDNKWKRQDQQQFINDQYYEEEDDEDEDEEEDEGDRSLEDSDASEEIMRVSKNKVRGRYKCETCNKMFRSYQALGGHRASHKKIKLKMITRDDEQELENDHNGRGSAPMVVEKKIHECPVCFRVFASGQALGGHKRTHVIGLSTTTTIHVPSSTKLGNNNFIDLNLPAPIDDDDISQIENSAVSDAEFVKTH